MKGEKSMNKLMTTSVAFTMLVIVLLMAAVVPLYADAATSGTDPFSAMGDQTSSISAIAKGNFGKLAFFVSLFVAVFCLLFTKHRIFGLVALAFGFLLGAYNGIANGLWTWFTSIGGN